MKALRRPDHQPAAIPSIWRRFGLHSRSVAELFATESILTSDSRGADAIISDSAARRSVPFLSLSFPRPIPSAKAAGAQTSLCNQKCSRIRAELTSSSSAFRHANINNNIRRAAGSLTKLDSITFCRRTLRCHLAESTERGLQVALVTNDGTSVTCGWRKRKRKRKHSQSRSLHDCHKCHNAARPHRNFQSTISMASP